MIAVWGANYPVRVYHTCIPARGSKSQKYFRDEKIAQAESCLGWFIVDSWIVEQSYNSGLSMYRGNTRKRHPLPQNGIIISIMKNDKSQPAKPFPSRLVHNRIRKPENVEMPPSNCSYLWQNYMLVVRLDDILSTSNPAPAAPSKKLFSHDKHKFLMRQHFRIVSFIFIIIPSVFCVTQHNRFLLYAIYILDARYTISYTIVMLFACGGEPCTHFQGYSGV